MLTLNPELRRAANMLSTLMYSSEGLSPPLTPKYALASILAGVSTTAFTIWVQEPPTARLICFTSMAYFLAYQLMRLTGSLQPQPGSISPAEMAEWRDRILSFINGALLTIGALLCFAEWPYSPASEGFVSQHIWSQPVTFAALITGYLQWDLCWVIWHQRSSPDVESVVHHTLFIAMAQYVLWGWYFKVPFAWLALAEISTPSLNVRWFLAVSKNKGAAYRINNVIFAVTFLGSRVIGYSFGIAHLWANFGLWRYEKTGLFAVVACIHLGFLLNLYWANGVVKAMLKAIRGGGASAKVSPKGESLSA